LKTLFYTSLALVAFAGNSLLCRLALKSQSIDPVSFTQIRLLSGALALILLVKIFHPKVKNKSLCICSKKRWLSAAFLFVYAILFSLAYSELDTATGALLLFAAVQITLFISHYIMGSAISRLQWLGSLCAIGGFIYLMLPSAKAPDLWRSLLMLLSGIAWGFYTLVGKRSRWPLLDNTHNFILTIPFVLLLIPYNYVNIVLTEQGVYFAIISGALASGAGYAIWYKALRGLTTMSAAVVQLLVPVIAAVGGLVLLEEPLSQELILSGVIILAGIMMVNYQPSSRTKYTE